MRWSVCISLLCIPLIAGGILSWQEPLAGDSFGAEVDIGSRTILPSSPVPTEETQSFISSANFGGSFAMCENEGPSLVDARTKAVNRVLQLARASLRHRTTSQLPPVLWACTFSVSLQKRNVRLQV